MVDVIQRLILEAETGNTKKELADVRKQQKALSDEIRKSASSTDKAKNETREMVDSLKALVDRERELERQLQQTNDAYGQRRKVLEANDRFDRTSQGVSLAGDLESNARTVGGAAGAFGLSGVERGIGAAAEIPAVLEALPRFQESLRGIPQVAQQAAQSLGTTVPTLGALGAASLALAAAMAFARKQAEDSRKAINAQFDSVNRRNEILQESANLTDEEIQAKLAEAEANRNLIQQQNEIAKAVQQGLDSQNLFIRGIGEVSSAIGIGNQAYGETDKRVRDTNASLEIANAEIEAYNEALDDNVNSTFEAAEAERALQAARTQSILNEASQAGELASLKQRVGDLTQEQIDSELESLDIRRTGLEAELAALKASGDTSEEVAKKIASLTSQIAFLGEQSSILSSARGGAVSEEAQKAREKAERDAEREQEKILRERERAATQAAKTQQSYTDAIDKAAQTYRDANQDISRNLNDAFLDIGQDLNDSLFDQQLDFNRAEQDAARDQQRSLEQIRRDANRSEQDAARQRNFAALAEARENAQEQRDDLRQETRDAARDRLLDFQREQQDLGRERDRSARDAVRDAQRARRDAAIARDRQLRDARNTYNQALRDQQQFGQKFVSNMREIFNQALGTQTGRPSTQSATNPTTQSRNSTFNDLLSQVMAA